MSLLIKALQKAEQEKTVEEKTSVADSGLSLELAPVQNTAPESELDNETGFSRTSDPVTSPAQNQKQVNQQAAATMFAAKSAPTNRAALSKSSLLAGAAVLLLLLLGGGFYFYLNSLSQPEVVMPKQVAALPSPTLAQPVIAQSVIADKSSEATDAASQTSMAVAEEEQQDSAKDIPVKTVEKAPIKSSDATVFNTQKDAIPIDNEHNGVVVAPIRKSQRNSTQRSQKLTFGDAIETANDLPMTVTRNQPATGINPDLISAYSAFKAGDDVTAQRYYRQVLQGDVRSVDALLGMAAIAARQGRSNDAIGWYGKVLEVEPRNVVAQSAMVSVMGQADPTGSESRIKNLLAEQPQAAYLYAALGAMYAGQNQWPMAQQSYFQALHFDAKNAEYAFNLAVSLDHMGKTALALQYYKTTLELQSKSGIGNIDRTQVESRIAQLE